MKRIFALILVTTTLLMARWDPTECKAQAVKIHNLQNSIVTRSFERLRRGDWAKYNDGTVALYLGRQKTPLGKLYGIEFQGSKMPVQQVWYEIVDKHIQTPFGTKTLRTLDPRLIYFQTGSGGVMRLEGPALQMALQRMGRLSTILTPGQVNVPLDCSHRTEVHEVTGYKLDNGEVINGAKIVDYETGGSVIVSDMVPFGLVGDRSGTPHLVAYGHGGIEPRIDEKAREAAQPMPPIPFFPGAM